MENLPRPHSGTSLPPQPEVQRTRVGARCEAILAQFWREDGVEDAVRALELEGWIDVLEGCSQAEIRAAWAEYQKEGPRSRAGRLLRPDAGSLYKIIMSARMRKFRAARAALPPPAPKPEPVIDYTARRAEAERILSEAGLAHTMPKGEL